MQFPFPAHLVAPGKRLALDSRFYSILGYEFYQVVNCSKKKIKFLIGIFVVKKMLFSSGFNIQFWMVGCKGDSDLLLCVQFSLDPVIQAFPYW